MKPLSPPLRERRQPPSPSTIAEWRRQHGRTKKGKDIVNPRPKPRRSGRQRKQTDFLKNQPEHQRQLAAEMRRRQQAKKNAAALRTMKEN